jgi:DNA processing protein
MIGVQSLGPVVPRRVSELSAPGPDDSARRAVVTGPNPRSPGPPGRHEERDDGRDEARDAERDAWVTLLGVNGLGPVTFAALLDAFGSASAVLAAAAEPAGTDRLIDCVAAGPSVPLGGGGGEVRRPADEPGEGSGSDAGHSRAGRPVIGADLSARICDAVASGRRTVELVRSLGLSVVTLDDPDYPVRLRAVDMPPPVLFVRGSLSGTATRRAIAVVGTRRATDLGRLTAGRIAAGLVHAGAAVVSGLAVGIDGAAHAAAVGEGGVTVAVLGSGHARLFPRAHDRLADAIVEGGGAVVSEHPPNTAPSRGTFPRRNRVVSGLSDAVVVVEAGEHSGALITAGWALEQGRDCYLVPGALGDPSAAGCNAFLRSFPGETRVVCGVPELIEDLGLTPETAAERGSAAAAGKGARGHSASAPTAGADAVLASLGPVEGCIAELLSAGPVTADELAARSGLAAAAVLGAVTLLELRGLATASFGRYLPSGPLALRGPSNPRRGPG